MSKRPHIIIFNPDEMRWDTMAHMGNPAAQTPFLDSFAAEDAVSFSNAYCQNPVCVPSRCSFFTGLYPHVNGHRTMHYLLHAHESNMFAELKNAGYYVWMNGRNDLVEGQTLGLFESQADEIFYGKGVMRSAKPKNPNPRGALGDKNFYSQYVGELSTNEEGISISGDDLTVQAAIQRIHNRKDDRPLCMFLGLNYPHTPYNVEEPYFSAIDRSKLPRRASVGTGKSRIEEKLREYMGMGAYTEEDWDNLRAVYLGMVMKVDKQFQDLCNALKEEGIYDDSAIFFLSDHGDFAGDYDIPEKAQNTFEDCLTRVPLLIKPPKGVSVDPGVSDSLVELVDFYATAMDFAGVVPDHDHFGKSLKPVLADRSQELRDYVFSEGGRMPYEQLQCDEYHATCDANGQIDRNQMYWPRKSAQADDDAHIKGTMIRNHQHKYVHRANGQHEFYDLAADPMEEHNLYGQPELSGTVEKMQNVMLNWYQATCDTVPRKTDSRFSFGSLWSMLAPAFPGMEEEAKELFLAGHGMHTLAAELKKVAARKEAAAQSNEA